MTEPLLVGLVGMGISEEGTDSSRFSLTFTIKITVNIPSGEAPALSGCCRNAARSHCITEICS